MLSSYYSFYPVETEDGTQILQQFCLRKVYTMRYSLEKEDGHWKQMFEGKTNSGEWKKLEEFLEDEVDESLHELIRCNVVTASRYFIISPTPAGSMETTADLVLRGCLHQKLQLPNQQEERKDRNF